MPILTGLTSLSSGSDAAQTPSMMREIRPLVAHLYQRDPRVYWRDFLISLTIGYACAIYYLLQPWGTWQTGAAFLVAGVCLYRVSMFIHEIVHFRPGEMRSFSIGWNLLAGIPMLIPSFFYDSHQSHHNTHAYGTQGDGEYLPLVHGGWRGLLSFLSEVILLPIYFVVRFMIGTPISLLIPGTRDWMLKRCSSFVMNLRYEHEIRKDAPRKLWAWIEVACFTRIALFIMLIGIGAAPMTRIPKIFALAMFTLTLNHIRTLAAHRYENEGESISHSNQFLDTTNITGNWLTELICPLGSQYHAVHHLFPRMPYHNLGKAHRLLSEHLPADSPYHTVTYPSCRAVIWELLRNIRNERAHRLDAHPHWRQSA